MTGARLQSIAERIERVALDPAGIEAQRLFRMARPVLALTRWRATVRYEALTRLLELLADSGARARLETAVDELEANVTTIERAAILRDRAPVAHAAWLRRAWELLVAVEGLLDRDDAVARQRLSQGDRMVFAPPLAILPPRETTEETGVVDAFACEVATREGAVPHADARIVELELAAIDHLLAAARAEVGFLGRKRRLLVAARQRLLDVSAALPLEPHGVRARADYVTREITRVDRLESIGLAADVSLVHQARAAIDRGDPRRLWAALSAVDAAALANDDHDVSRVTSRAVKALWGGEDPRGVTARRASLRRSANAMLGEGGVGLVEEAMKEARREARATIARSSESQGVREDAEHLLREAYAEGAERGVLAATVTVDGCFEVGGALAPVRVDEEARVLRAVRFPTQTLVLVPAEGVDDLPDATISDPRSVLLDLVTGRLLTRRYVRPEPQRRSRVVMRSEVRVFVLDGSTSMAGPRGHVRDALLVAELATLSSRLAVPGDTRATLLFRYFDESPLPVTRVDSVEGARAAMRDVLTTTRRGGTNIQKALVASLEQVAEARAVDRELTHAQLVLVTDGEAAVDEELVAAARAKCAGLPLGVSVIALGTENPALRALVARQRAAGEVAFYHHLDDAQLASITAGELDGGVALHLPDSASRPASVVARDLAGELGPLVDELVAIERARESGVLQRLDDEARALRELDASDAKHDGREGASARLEAANRDRVAIGARFARWFPEPAGGVTVEANRARRPRLANGDVEAVVCALSSVAEVVALLGGSELTRKADAIELLERLLPDARLTPARLRATLRDHATEVAPALAAVHAAVRG